MLTARRRNLPPAAATIRVRSTLATVAINDMELSRVTSTLSKQFVLADETPGTYITLQKEYKEFPGAVGKLHKTRRSTAWCNRASGCWNMKLTDKLKTLGLEQSQSDPCLLRKGRGWKGDMILIVAVHVDGLILVAGNGKEGMNHFVAELGVDV